MADLKFTDKAEGVLKQAFELAEQNQCPQVHPLHLACALWEDSTPVAPGGTTTPTLFRSSLEKAGGDAVLFQRQLLSHTNRIPSNHPAPQPPLPLAPSLHTLLKSASTIQTEQRDAYIAVDHLLLALLKSESPELRALWTEAKVDKSLKDRVEAEVKKRRGTRRVDSKNAEEGFEALNKYAIDVTALAEQGKLDPVIGRDDIIRRCIRVLCRRTKSNPVLIGEPGVGKTAVVEGLAQRIVARDVPVSLLGRLYSLDMGALMAGAKYKGEYEERIKGVLNEIEKAGDEGTAIILFIDEMHLIMAGQGAEGGGMDAANLLKPLLARGKLRCIGATTLAEYRKYIEKDSAFERRFAQVLVDEPDVPTTVSILRGLKEKYEAHHGVEIQDGALVLAAQLAKQYLTARRLPDSAIDLIDEASSSVKIQRETRPEAIDVLERKKLSLEVEIHALEREKDEASRERLEQARKALADVEEELSPMVEEYNQTKNAADAIQDLKKRIDELKAKADEAERRYDLASASDIRYYSIPQRQKKLTELEERARQQGEQISEVTSEMIAEVVARWTGIPVTSLVQSERQKLLKMEKTLSKNVIGQPAAVNAVANAIRLNRSGLGNSNRPIASFLLVGPSGTGKTLLAKTVAQSMFNSADAMIRIDASEFSEKHTVSRLVGSTAGYIGYEEGGQLTEYVRRHPYCLVLVDEIEKASKEFVMLFLQILDDGRLTDGKGRVIDFRNTIIMMTSNLGATYMTEHPSEGDVDPAVKTLVNDAISKHFPPEFINRIDEIIFYRSLTAKDIRRVVEVRLKEIQDRMAKNGRKIKINVDEQAKNWLAQAGYSPIYGARPLARVIQQELLNPLSKLILQGRIHDGEVARVTADVVKNRLVVMPNHDLDVQMVEDDDDSLTDDKDEDDDDMKVEELD